MYVRTKITQSLFRVCLCGRPNVGKSTLFNRLVGRKQALVLNQPGVTRDVYRSEVSWDFVKIELADLAGLELNSKNELRKLAESATLDYLKKSNLVLFLVDARAGITPLDEQLARLVRSFGKKVLVILSKVEGRVEEQARSEAAILGWPDILATSAEHNRGIADLKETILKTAQSKQDNKENLSEDYQKHKDVLETPDNLIRIGIYGRPNVGKSTFVNYLIGENRMITSPIAGTTIDTIHTDFIRSIAQQERTYRIFDTAGIRRKSKTKKGVEVLSVVKALKSLSLIDIALFIIDGFEGLTDQDEKVAGEIVKQGKPVVILVNKWDLCKVNHKEYAERIRNTLGFLDFSPILFISAQTGQGIKKIWDLIDEVLENRKVEVPTAELNRFFKLVENRNNPTGVKLFYASQTSKNPPTITCIVNKPKKVHFAFERFLKNELRNRYGWMGNPLRLIFKSRRQKSPSPH